MPILTVLLVVLVVGVALWLINKFIPMQRTIKSILNIIVVVVLVIWLINVFDIMDKLQL